MRQVSNSALQAAGLNGMQQISDDEGMEIRGRSFSAAVKGTSLIFFQLLTPDTKNFLVGSSVNEVDGFASTSVDPVLAKDHLVFVGTLSDGQLLPNILSVSYDNFDYVGAVAGVAGGTGSVSFTFGPIQ